MIDDEAWMRRAFALARRGASGASPNPLVGCVIVRNGRVVGESYHARFGGPHAEVRALGRAGRRSAGATLYVNLEPCSHWGKTPPCADAILSAGVRKVVAAVSDPNPLVAGKGFRRLRREGVTVSEGVCRTEARELNRAFFKFIHRKRPYVVVKSAMSADGKIATAAGQSQWISSRPARDFSHKLRTEVDAILVGAETVRRDDPSLTSHGKGRDPVRVVITASGRLPAQAKIFDGKSPTWIWTGGKPAVGKNADWIRAAAPKGRIDFKSLLDELAARGVSKLLIEGGGRTAAEALESGEVDEVFLVVAPLLIGGAEAPTPFDGQGARRLKDALRLTGMTARRLGPDLLLHARIGN